MAKRSRGKISTELSNFTILHNEFIDSKLLSGNEKLVFIAIKRHLNSESLQAFPSIKTICNHTGMSKPTVVKAIKSLEEKEILTVERRESDERGHMSNLYTLMDCKEIWKATSVDNMKVAARTRQYEWAKQIIEAAGGRVIEIEKELKSETDQSTDLSPINKLFSKNNNTQKRQTSQDQEKYSYEMLRKLYNYEAMVNDNPEHQKDVDHIISILYDTLNSSKSKIRIAGNDRPAAVVIGKLLKLDKEAIMYVIRKYESTSTKIEQPEAYILTMLYKAPEQYALELQNQFSVAEAAADTKDEY